MAHLEVALTRLEAIRPRLRALVERKVFEGMTLNQVASSLQCSAETVIRQWRFARHMLQNEVGFAELG